MSHPPHGISIDSAILQGSPLCPTDRHTDRQTTIFVAIGRIYAMQAMLPNKRSIM